MTTDIFYVSDNYGRELQVELPVEIGATYKELCQKYKTRYLMEAVQAAALYAACRIHHQPRTLEEVKDLTGIPVPYIGKAFNKMGLKLPLSKPEEYIDRHLASLGYNDPDKLKEISERAKRIIESARHCEDFCCVCNKVPSSVASGAVYISGILSGDRRTQVEVAEACHITSASVNKHYKDLAKKADIIDRVLL